MSDITRHLTTTAAELAPLEVLHAPPTVLVGVSAEAAAALKTLEIGNVFELATSKVFGNAQLLVDAASDPRSVLAQFGASPGDVVEAVPPDVAVGDLHHQGLAILAGIGAAKAAGISDALDVKTVRELALWPQRLAAVEILRATFFPDTVDGADLDTPRDLLPRSGEYPTERVFYSTLVLDSVEEDAGVLALEQAGQVDVAPVAGANFGFKKPAIGALLTFAQSWYAEGVTLGQLLHSVALAPGENTRIAMVDWSRRTAGRQSEDLSETEQLTNVTDHSRALGEVTAAVASEAQSGFSESKVRASSSEGGGGGGFSLGPITLGATGSSARSQSDAMSFSSSTGRRDLSASMSQNVVDRTQQHANAARNRRATVVKEVSQDEHEAVSTRVVANYNHMHALSVQYYEVVQIYRVSVALSRVEKCFYVPMQLIDFTKPELVRRFRIALAGAPVDESARTLLTTNFDIVEMAASGPTLLGLSNPFGFPALLKPSRQVVELPNDAELTAIDIIRSRGGINDLPQLTALTVKLRDGNTATIERAATSGKTSDNMKVTSRAPIHEIRAIEMTAPAGPEDHKYYCTFVFKYKGGSISVDASILVEPGAPRSVISFTGGGVRQLLRDHLQANRLHYSQVVFRSLDASEVSLLLSQYSFGGKPLVSQVDPSPVTVAGNYMVLKMHTMPDRDSDSPEERAWATWLAEHGVSFDQVEEDLVPLPSGGVFAEAVLGRYNSAEKLDVTRFWNWQDSPIPLQAPQIADIQAGSRSTPEDLKPGQFSSPMVNIVSPTSIPDPSGMAGVLAAIANGSMFRDMSGLAATAALARSGLETTSEAAGRAGAQAGANLVTAAQKEVEMAKTAVAAMQAMMGNPSAESGSGANISKQGAMINHGRGMDSRGVGDGVGSGGGGGVPATGGGGGHSGGGAGATGGEGAGGPVAGGPNETEATRAALWPRLGEAPGAFLQNAVAAGGGEDATALGPRTAVDPKYFYVYGLSQTGTSSVKSTPLGINPNGAFVNAVDISAKNTISSPVANGTVQPPHSKFRWRQTVSQKGFQKVGAAWQQVFHTIGSEADDPDPLLQVYDAVRGWFRMLDTPGWPSPAVQPTTRNLDLGGGNKSADQAVEVVVKMFLQTWVEGLTPSGSWETISSNVFEWCSVQWLKRTTPAAKWTKTPGTLLVTGANAMREFAKSPDDVDL